MEKENYKSEVRKELETLAPHLAKLKKRSGTNPEDDLPPRYFKELPNALWQRLQEEEKGPEPSSYPENWRRLLIAMKGWLQPPLALGFTTVIILVVAFWAFRHHAPFNWMASEADQLSELEEIPNDVLLEYVLEQMANFETADFAELEQHLPWNSLLPIHQEVREIDGIIDEYMEQEGDFLIDEFL